MQRSARQRWITGWSAAGRCAALAAIVAAAACAPPPRPNVLFIVVDTLRADRLGCYGYARDTSPSIDALARSGVRFERAYAAASWTKPSIASMLTGLHPGALGIDNVFSRLPQSAETLAEIFSAAGYATSAVVSHVMLSDRWEMGFGQGYEHYDETESKGHAHVSTGGVTARAIAQLGELADGERPFLLFVHYFDPHFDYLDHPGIDFAPASDRIARDEDIASLRARIDTLEAADLSLLGDRYDEEIRLTDAGVGELLAALDASGRRDDTIVVFTADHGEELGEKGWLGHTRNLHEMIVRVPLIVRAPGSQPGVVATPVSLVSLAPTLLDLTGIDFAPARFHGATLAPALRGERLALRSVFVETDFPLQDPRIAPQRVLKRALVGERFKLVADDAAGTLALYDLRDDPAEAHDVSDREPSIRAALLDELRDRATAARLGGPPAEVVELSEAELEVLRKLGYVETPNPDDALSPDPRP